QLTLDGIRCGQLTCPLEEYCSSETNRCAPCSIVCNKTHHNYDDYLLDLRYMRRSEESPASTDLSGVQRQATTSLIVSGVALAILVLILVIVCRGKFSWRYIKQKFQPAKVMSTFLPIKKTHISLSGGVPKFWSAKIRQPEPPKRTPQPLNVRDLETRTSQTEKSQGATTPKTMSTALSNRHPAEDTTLDFSYDNMGMNVTPPENTATSHKF
ncbi:Period protein, partial [Operophtera brumata]